MTTCNEFGQVPCPCGEDSIDCDGCESCWRRRVGPYYGVPDLEYMAMAKPAKQAAINAKEKSIAVARATIGKIQHDVLRALDGESLLGLPNLGTARDTYHAVNVRAADPARKFWRGDDKPTLIISRTGQLQVVTFGHDEIVYEDANLDKLLPGDLMAVTERYKVALELHLARCQDSMERSEKVVSLARAIEQALEGSE